MTGKVKRIDVHSHVLPRELIELIRQRPRDCEMRVEGAGDQEIFVRDDKHGTPVYAEFFDADAKVEGMDRKGIDISVISVTPVVFFYWLPAAAGLAACRVMNDGIARMAAARPDRLRGMATLPMQDTDAPVDMAEDDPVAMINAVPGLTDEHRARIFGLNALELLGELTAHTLNPP